MRPAASLLVLALTLHSVFASSHPPKKHIVRPRQGFSTGSCGSVAIQFATGLDGQSGTTYKPVNQQDFSHGASKEIDQIATFICSRIRSPCNAPAASVDKCNSVAASVSGQSGGSAADNWNGAFGISSNFGGGNANTVTTTTKAQAQPVATSPKAQVPADNVAPTSATTPTAIRQEQQAATSTASVQPQVQSQVSAASQSSSVTTASATNILDANGRVTVSVNSQVNGVTSGSAIITQATQTTNAAGVIIPMPMSSTVAAVQPTATADVVNPDDVATLISEYDCVLQAVLVTVTLPAGAQVTPTVRTGNEIFALQNFTPLDLGACTDPTIVFGQGLGGRDLNEMAFQNNNQSQFPHESTLDIATLSRYTCDNLVNKCGLSTNSPAVIACNAAETAANAKGDWGAAADLFNRGMGFSTFYAAVDGS